MRIGNSPHHGRHDVFIRIGDGGRGEAPFQEETHNFEDLESLIRHVQPQRRAVRSKMLEAGGVSEQFGDAEPVDRLITFVLEDLESPVGESVLGIFGATRDDLFERMEAWRKERQERERREPLHVR